MRPDFPGCSAALADRNAHDHQIGAFDRLRVGVDDLIREAEFHDAPAGLRRTCRRHDAADEFLCPCGARDGRPDQADPDQREASELGGGRHEGTACSHPPLEGEGRTAEGSPGWGDTDAGGNGDAAYVEALSPPPGPLTRADLPPAEPRSSEGSATRQSDRSRQQPTSVGGGDSRLLAGLRGFAPLALILAIWIAVR